MDNFTKFLEQFNQVYIWADQHFHHSKVIHYGTRPFTSAEEMDATMEKNWKETVGPDDLLIHCGDFTFGGNTYANDIMSRCPGTNFLIIGNHDLKKAGKVRNLNFDYMSWEETFQYNDNEFILTHVPLAINLLGTRYGIHGHIHNEQYHENGIRSLYHECVSVEHTNYKPILLSDVCDKMINRVQNVFAEQDVV